ncbi:hypothetical protein DL98DRAFT_534112 [Cadophora sp. DSE1049]|nr:hypothetical protein DL98DRAFT_534112 [Cadophora sp. DSE1049]
MTQNRNRMSPQTPEKSRPPQSADNSIEEDRSFSDIEDDDVSVQSDVTLTPHNVSRTRRNDAANDSGVGSEVSTPVLERHMAGLSLGSDNKPPDLEIAEPLEGHKRLLTVVLLHSNGSSGAELKHQLLEATKCSSGKTLQEELPGLRWIFPTAPIVIHVKSDRTIEKRRIRWKRYQNVRKPKMHHGHGEKDCRVRGMNIGLEKKIRDKVSWEHNEVVFGGYWQGAAPALVAWMCSGTNFAGFIGIRGVLPDQKPITQKYNEDVADGRPPGRGSDFDKHTHDFITSWTSILTRQNNPFVPKMASTPVLLTLHEGDTHWLFDSEKLARSLYNTLIGPASNLFTNCLGSPFTLQQETQGQPVEELDAIRDYLRCLTVYRKGGGGVTVQEWIKKQAKLF